MGRARRSQARLAPQPLAVVDVPVVGAPYARDARHFLVRAKPPRGCRERLTCMSKVLLVTNIFPPEIGGPATFIDRLGHSLASRDHRVTVVCTSQGSRHDSDRERPFAVRRVSFASRERYEVLVRMRLALEMARHRLIFVNGLERYVAEVNRVTRRPYVLKIVGDTVWETARNRGMTNLSIDDFQIDAATQAKFAADIQGRNAWVGAARHIVVPSEYLRRLVEGWGVARERITVVQNGTIATGAASPATARRPRALPGALRGAAHELERASRRSCLPPATSPNWSWKSSATVPNGRTWWNCPRSSVSANVRSSAAGCLRRTCAVRWTVRTRWSSPRSTKGCRTRCSRHSPPVCRASCRIEAATKKSCRTAATA